MAAALLALAACGGGDSAQTVPMPAEKPVVQQPEPAVENPDPAIVSLSGISEAAKAGAALAVKRPLEGVPFMLVGSGFFTATELDDVEKGTIHHTSMVNKRTDIFAGLNNAREPLENRV